MPAGNTNLVTLQFEVMFLEVYKLYLEFFSDNSKVR